MEIIATKYTILKITTSVFVLTMASLASAIPPKELSDDQGTKSVSKKPAAAAPEEPKFDQGECGGKAIPDEMLKDIIKNPQKYKNLCM